MKKETKNNIILQFENIINNYSCIEIFMKNYKSITADIESLQQKTKTLKEIKNDEIEKLKENKKEYSLFGENLKNIHEKYKNIFDDYKKQIELYETMLKAYKNIINNGLYLVLNDIVLLMIENCKNKRDLNEFFEIFNEYDKETRKYKFLYYVGFSQNYKNSIEISYNMPELSSYNIFESNLYLYYYYDEKNTIVFDPNKQYNHNENMEKIKNYSDYFVKINNVFGFENVKNNCLNLLKVYEEEASKQRLFIIESNNKIDNANIYNLDGFKQYGIL